MSDTCSIVVESLSEVNHVESWQVSFVAFPILNQLSGLFVRQSDRLNYSIKRQINDALYGNIELNLVPNRHKDRIDCSFAVPYCCSPSLATIAH